jgi:hypothetical protein
VNECRRREGLTGLQLRDSCRERLTGLGRHRTCDRQNESVRREIKAEGVALGTPCKGDTAVCKPCSVPLGTLLLPTTGALGAGARAMAAKLRS